MTPVFVGRSEETRELNAALAAVQGGAGRCVLITGDAGIGKSRLIADVHGRAVDNGFATLAGRCFEQDRSFPYAPIIDMLRPYFAQGTAADLLDALGPPVAELVKLLPELASQIPETYSPSSAGSEVEKRRLFEALMGLLLRQAEAGPLLIVVEDLHWSDEASLEFLLYLVRRMAQQPILLLLSRRRSGAPAGLVNLLGGLDREPIAQEIELKPLTRAEMRELLKAIFDQPQEVSAAFVEKIYSLTEGNPFFAEEICTSLMAGGEIYYNDNQWRRKPLSQIDIPDSVQRLVRQRLDRVGGAARQLMDLAAVSGRNFDFAVLQTLTGHDDAELTALVKELMAAKLVVEESAEQFSFRHALTREALYERLLTRERQPLHRKIVGAIEQLHGSSSEAHLEALAYHSFEARVWRKAFNYGREAGEKALALYAPHAAIEHFTRAIKAADRLSATPPSSLYRLRGQAYDILGNFDRASEDYETALQLVRAAGDRQGSWQLLLDLGLLWASRDYERSGDYCQQALALARSMEDEAAIGRSLNRVGNWQMNSGKPQEALDTHQEALALFESVDDRAGIAATLDLLAMTSNMCGDYEGTVNYYEQAIPLLRRLNDRQTLVTSLTMLSNYTLDEAQVREAIELSREIDWRAGEAFALVYLGSLMAYRGNYGRGLRAAKRGLELAQAIDHRQWQAWGETVLGLIYLELLAPDEAYRHLQRSRALATEVGSGFMITVATALLASTCLLLDRHEEAAALLPEPLPESIGGADYMSFKARLELALVHSEDPTQAMKLSERLALPKRAHWCGAMAYFFGSTLMLRGKVLTRLDRSDEAEAALQNALSLCQEQGVQMGLWRIHLALGKLYQDTGDRSRAEAAFDEARELIEALAATLSDEGLQDTFSRRARAMIPPAQQLTPRQAAKQKFGGLTRRERQVAAVVARGLTNQEIADELVVSIKTVEAHVTRILSKLGFSSRTQIAAWAVDKGLAPPPQDLDSLAADG